jgi:hypothetical protein
MQEELRKSLVDLIDETLCELDELKKSSRFAASEIKIEGPGDGIAGKPVNGSLGKEEDEKDDEDDEDNDIDKAEGKNSEADPNAGNHQVVKAEDEDEDEDEDKKIAQKEVDKHNERKHGESKDENSAMKAEGKNSEADPNAGNHQAVYKDDTGYSKGTMAKSIKEANEAQEKLLKSYVDERFSSFEDKLSKMADMIAQIADAPVAPKGASYKDVQPLAKSAYEGYEPLNKSQLVNKLFDLKKSGEAVDTDDIIGIETGGISDLSKIVAKYNIK